MTTIDWTMVALFFAVLVGIPLAAARKGASSSKEFFLSGQSMPWWLLGISMVAATTSTNSSNLFTEIIRSKGMGGNWAWWAFLLTGLLTVFVYSKLWRRSGVTTDIGFYELRYSGKPAAFLRCFRTLYLGVFFNLIVMAFVTLGAVKIGVIVFGVPAWVILVVAAVASVIYAAFGGLRGMVYTDFFLFALVMIGAVISMVFALNHPAVGGLSGLVANPAVASQLDFLPSPSNPDLFMAVFVIPVALQWWSVWWPGSEPGGGGYIVQRMLSAKNENHAMGAALFFNVMNYAIRPWPWFIVGLASIVVFPQLADIQKAFPNVDPKLVGGDMAYPAMMTVIPKGWFGLVVASLMGALFSTLAAHINMGASYVVNDFYRRFLRPQAGDRELVFVARVASVLFIAAACVMAPFMESAKTAFDFTLQIGAGTGLVYLLRWFWLRINAWSEVAAMSAAALFAAFLQFVYPHLGGPVLATWVKLAAAIVFTTVVWVSVTLLTKPVDAKTLETFKATVRADGRDVGRGVLATFLAAVAIFTFMYAVGAWVYGWYAKAALATAASVAVGLATAGLFRGRPVQTKEVA